MFSSVVSVGLDHIDLFSQLSVQKGCADIHLMHSHVEYGCYSQYDPKKFKSSDRCDCFILLDNATIY